MSKAHFHPHLKAPHGGYQFGTHGHVYKTKGPAEAQMRAAYANGYQGHHPAQAAADHVAKVHGGKQ